MSYPPHFIIDSNVLVESHRIDYGFDICPGYWYLLEKAFDAGLVIGHKKMLDEILKNDDDLSRWMKRVDKGCFPKETDSELEIYLQMSKWVDEGDYNLPAKERFKAPSYADPWICAKAKELGLVLVTQEVSAPLSKKDVKLPDACMALGVSYCNKYTMLRDLKACFELAASHTF